MNWFRELLLGNWRNKGVALFFAVTIWFVVFQAEKQEWPGSSSVFFLPADPQATIITRAEVQEPETKNWIPFQRTVALSFSGPRKQIENLKQEVHLVPHSARIKIARDVEVYTFRPEDFGYPRDGIELLKITPAAVRVLQEDAHEEVVGNLEQFLSVAEMREGFELKVRRVEPNELRIRAPESIWSSVHPTIEIPLGYNQRRFVGEVAVNVIYSEGVGSEHRDNVTLNPKQVKVEIDLEPSWEVLAVKEVPITFRIAPPSVPIKIVVQDLSGGTIPLEFHGPRDEVSNLEAKLRRPGFSVSVPVQSDLDLAVGTSLVQTFSEDSLELLGFPGVQMRPHKDRPKTPWVYRIVAVKEETR